jgi:hypothetical protein
MMRAGMNSQFVLTGPLERFKLYLWRATVFHVCLPLQIQTGQSICSRTGQFYLLTTMRYYFIDSIVEA